MIRPSRFGSEGDGFIRLYVGVLSCSCESWTVIMYETMWVHVVVATFEQCVCGLFELFM